MSPEEHKEAAEHRDAILCVRAVLATSEGKSFFKYLLKCFDVGEMPPQGLEGMFLHDLLGFRRAGTAIFKLASEADAAIAGALLAEVEKERHVELHHVPKNEQG